MSILKLTTSDLLNSIPQQKPFRFVDEILSVDEEHICGHYTFREDEFFYAGHYPGKPITPGVILMECMAQIGVVALGIYLRSLEVSLEETKNWLAVFTETEVEFSKSVYPGEKVIVTAKKIFWRRMKLRSNITMRDSSGNLLASGAASGIGIKK
jgi:3-hydroxyacyl-[acyl-carrier-protein] dehydratase